MRMPFPALLDHRCQEVVEPIWVISDIKLPLSLRHLCVVIVHPFHTLPNLLSDTRPDTEFGSNAFELLNAIYVLPASIRAERNSSATLTSVTICGRTWFIEPPALQRVRSKCPARKELSDFRVL